MQSYAAPYVELLVVVVCCISTPGRGRFCCIADFERDTRRRVALCVFVEVLNLSRSLVDARTRACVCVFACSCSPLPHSSLCSSFRSSRFLSFCLLSPSRFCRLRLRPCFWVFMYQPACRQRGRAHDPSRLSFGRYSLLATPTGVPAFSDRECLARLSSHF